MQTTLLSFAIAMILALLAALVGPYFINWNDHRAFFEAEASRLVGVPVRVSGNIDAGILPFPSVTLGDIAIRSLGETSGLRARSLRIEFALGPLMRGEMRAVEMKLAAPQLSIGIDKEGQLDWPALALETETLAIDRLSIENGRITLNDAVSHSQMTLDQVSFSGAVRSLAGPFNGKGKFVTGGVPYGYDVSAGRRAADGIRVKMALKTDERPLNIEAEGLFALDHGVPNFDGVLTLARPAGAVLASGKVVSYEPWRLTSKIQAGSASAVLENVAFQYGPDERAATLTGSANFTFGTRMQLQGRLAARQIDLDRLLATTAAPRRRPLAAVQAFGEMIGNALRPSWPVNLAIGVDGLTMGGALVQAVNCDLQSDGTNWSVEKLEFRAPGATQVRVQGRLYPLGNGLGFAGGTVVDSNDPKSLAGWLTGNPAAIGQSKPWHATGDITLGADRIAVERLRTDFGRGAVEGSASYTWPAAAHPARLEANLRAAEFDVDTALGFGVSAFSGLGLEPPREVALAVEIDRALIATLEARNVTARMSLDAKGLAIERLSIADFGNAAIEASGRIDTEGSPGGDIALDLNARDIDGVAALAEKTVPFLAAPLRRLAGQQKTAKLHAVVSLAKAGTDTARGKLDVKGNIGTVRIHVAASASGKRDAFTNPRLLGDTDIKLDGQIDADEPAPLLALLGLDRIAVTERKGARLSFTAQGLPGRNFGIEGKFGAGPLDLGGKGVFRFPGDQPATLDLGQIGGTIGGEKVSGRLALRFEDRLRADGSFETGTLDVPALIATAIGMHSAGPSGGWSIQPLARGLLPALTGTIAFKAERAVFANGLAAQQLRGMTRFGASELVFENVAGEIGKGRFEGRLAFEDTQDGLSARARIALNDADAGAVFGNDSLHGRLSVQGEVEGTGRSPAAVIGSLAGYGSVTLDRAQIVGVNPGVFSIVERAVELGIPSDGDRIRQFVTGVLDTTKSPVTHATAGATVIAGMARFDEIVVPMAGSELKAGANLNLGDGGLDALLTLTGQAAPGSRARPALLIGLTGPVLAPKRTIDTTLLTNWLTLLTVEQHSKQIDAMEKAAREMNPASKPIESNPEQGLPDATAPKPPPSTALPSSTPASAGGQPSGPPPAATPPAPKPRAPVRSENSNPRGGILSWPRALFGAQN